MRSRAEGCVVSYLEDHYHIESERLQAIGYGKRIADNSTEEGRQKNRRVQIANVGS